MTKPRFHSLPEACAALLLAGLAACGSNPVAPPTPPPTTLPPPVTRVIHNDTFAVGSKFVYPDTFSTSTTGSLEVTVDWTFTSNDVDIFVARGVEPCTLATFNDRSCGFVATEESTTMKPEKLTISNLAAGTYTLYVANFGSSNESVACHITLTSASAASAPVVRALSTGGTADKGKVNRILDPRSAN